MKTVSWINFLMGVWLTIAAFALSARTGSVMAAEGVAGVVIAVLAYASAVARPNAAVSWSVAIAGLWTLIVNFGAHTPATLNAPWLGWSCSFSEAPTLSTATRRSDRAR